MCKTVQKAEKNSKFISAGGTAVVTKIQGSHNMTAGGDINININTGSILSGIEQMIIDLLREHDVDGSISHKMLLNLLDLGTTENQKKSKFIE